LSLKTWAGKHHTRTTEQSTFERHLHK